MRGTSVALLAVVLAMGAVVSAASCTPPHAASEASPDASTSPAFTQPPVAAIGIPGEDLGTQRDAGAVEVRYADGRRQILFPSAYRAGDHFGAATAVVEIDGDAYPDLVVGAPGRDVGGVPDAGAVFLYRGSAKGFRPWRVLVQGSGGVPGSAQAGAGFGAVISAYGDQTAALAVGMPRWDTGGAVDAGAVVLLTLTRSASPQVSGTLLTEGSAGLPGTPESGDLLGAALDGERAFGAPGKTVNGARGAGAVYVRLDPDAASYTMITQDTPGMPGAAEPGDGFGSAVVQAAPFGLWIVVPGEDLGDTTDAGMVNTFGDVDEDGVPREPGPSYTQNSRGVAGVPEPGDRFGTALARYAPGEQSDADVVLVGVPGEDIGSIRDAGMVDELWTDGVALTQARTAGTEEPGDRFGSTLVAGSFFDADPRPRIIVGAPGEDAGAGAVVVVYGSTAVIWKQTTGTPEHRDGYGTSVAARLG